MSRSAKHAKIENVGFDKSGTITLGEVQMSILSA